MAEKIKKVAKYTLNCLTIVNFLLVELDPIWGIPCANKIIPTVGVVMAAISTYLLGGKAVSKIKGE